MLCTSLVTKGLFVLGIQNADLAELMRILQRELQTSSSFLIKRSVVTSPCHQHEGASALLYKLEESQEGESESHTVHTALAIAHAGSLQASDAFAGSEQFTQGSETSWFWKEGREERREKKRWQGRLLISTAASLSCALTTRGG